MATKLRWNSSLEAQKQADAAYARLKPKTRRKSKAKPEKKSRRLNVTHLTYQQYLKTKWWKSRRKQALDDAGHKCHYCEETTGLEVHHLSYKRLGREKKKDLMVVCHWHHLNSHPEHCEGDNLPEELRPPVFS